MEKQFVLNGAMFCSKICKYDNDKPLLSPSHSNKLKYSMMTLFAAVGRYWTEEHKSQCTDIRFFLKTDILN